MKKAVSILLAAVILLSLTAIPAYADGNGDHQSKITPELQELIDETVEHEQIEIAIYFNEKPKTVDEMPSWPDPDKAPLELRDYLFYHNMELALDILGPDYVGRTVYSRYVHYLIKAWYPGYVTAECVDVGDIARIASDNRVRKLDMPARSEDMNPSAGMTSQLDNVLKAADPDDYICVSIQYNGEIKKRRDFGSDEEYEAYIDSVRNEFFTEIFGDTDEVILDEDMRYGYVEAAVRARDVEKIASSGMTAYVFFNDYGIIFNNGYIYSVDNKGEEPGRANYLYEFDEAYGYSKQSYPSYKELCYHKDENGSTDWVLLRVESEYSYPVIYMGIIGNRVYEDDYYMPFECKYGVYDVKQKKFYDLNGYTAARYKDLGRIFDQIGEGRLLGDMDRDDDLTAVDVTLIMRCEVRMRDWPEDDEFRFDEFGGIMYYSDFNRDGERDIVDATKLQRYIIGMDD